MELSPDEFVFIEIHMRRSIVDELRSAARRAGLPVEDWLVQLLVDGVTKPPNGGRV